MSDLFGRVEQRSQSGFRHIEFTHSERQVSVIAGPEVVVSVDANEGDSQEPLLTINGDGFVANIRSGQDRYGSSTFTVSTVDGGWAVISFSDLGGEDISVVTFPYPTSNHNVNLPGEGDKILLVSRFAENVHGNGILTLFRESLRGCNCKKRKDVLEWLKSLDLFAVGIVYSAQ